MTTDTDTRPEPATENSGPQPHAFRERRTPPAAVGVMLRAARNRAGLGVRETARRAGIVHSHLIGLEQGTRCPSAAVAEALAIVLDLDPAERTLLASAAVNDAGRSRTLP
jgi:transcriptional regulator with XRE-family HTH domain